LTKIEEQDEMPVEDRLRLMLSTPPPHEKSQVVFRGKFVNFSPYGFDDECCESAPVE